MVSKSAQYEQLYKLGEDFVHSYDFIQAGRDITALSRTLAPDCRRFYLPESFTKQRPALAKGETNTEYEAHHAMEISICKPGWNVELKDITVDEVQRKIVAHTLFTLNSQHSNKEYNIEGVYTLWANEQTKVQKIMQYMDMATTGQFIADHQVLFAAKKA